MEEITCNFYCPISGKWRGIHTYTADIILPHQLTNQSVVEECLKEYSNSEKLIIHVSYRQLSKLILPIK